MEYPTFDIGSYDGILKSDELNDGFNEILSQYKYEDTNGAGSETNAKRFKKMEESEMTKIMFNSKRKSTHRTTNWGVKIFADWLAASKKNPTFEDIPPEQLNDLLRQFYAEVRTTSGAYYAKSSYVGIRSSLHRYLTQPPLERTINIMQDPDFLSANNMFDAMLKQLKQKGKDNPTHHPAISSADLEKIRQNQRQDDPQQLQNKVWFDLTLGFGRCGCENSRELNVNSFSVEQDDVGDEFISITHTEATKNHPGGIADNQYAKPRIYGNDSPSCPLTSFKKYVSKLNPENRVFYQLPKKTVTESDAIWYTRKALGHNTLNQMMKHISTDLSLSRKYTNHCVRATTVTILSHARVEAREIIKITGHRNTASLTSYNIDS